MTILKRRRLLYWIIKEYLKRWGKTIFLSFVLGFAIFFLIYVSSGYFISKIPIGHRESIGFVGTYTTDILPDSILEELSEGLTSVSQDGTIAPNLAQSWNIENNGKKYTFFLKPNIFYTDGTKLISRTLPLEYSDVTIEHPNDRTVVFNLKDPYAPFLSKVSDPLFKKGFVGVSLFKLNTIKLNGTFVKSLTLVSLTNKYDVKILEFYDTEDALKLAFTLGEVSSMKGLTNLQVKNSSFTSYPNVKIEKIVDYNHLVTLFYNLDDNHLSEKRLRQALSYSLPDSLPFGERSYAPYKHSSIFYQKSVNEPKNDLAHAKLLLGASSMSSGSADLEITTLPKYKEVAETISKSWKDLGIKSHVKTTDNVPTNFQIFLGDFKVPKDPDQYSLWHSNQSNNITNFKNLRIDKLLEDGRKTIDIEMRKKIYADFQKYLLDETPASFLYFPYEYNVTRQ